MPIIKPEIQKVLRAAGLEKEVSQTQDNMTMEERLAQAGLSSETLAEELSSLALHSNSEHLKLRALETALRIKGALKEQPAQLPSFTIVIQNSSVESQDKINKAGGINPILFPRKSLESLD